MSEGGNWYEHNPTPTVLPQAIQFNPPPLSAPTTAEKSKDETKDASEHTVALEKFGKVTSIYGPLICPTDPSKNIVKKIFDILQNEWVLFQFFTQSYREQKTSGD